MIKNEYIAINGRLESMTKKEAKEKILELGGFFQQDINSKTTIVINGYQPTKKKKQKIKEPIFVVIIPITISKYSLLSLCINFVTI